MSLSSYGLSVSEFGEKSEVMESSSERIEAGGEVPVVNQEPRYLSHERSAPSRRGFVDFVIQKFLKRDTESFDAAMNSSYAMNGTKN